MTPPLRPGGRKAGGGVEAVGAPNTAPTRRSRWRARTGAAGGRPLAQPSPPVEWGGVDSVRVRLATPRLLELAQAQANAAIAAGLAPGPSPFTYDPSRRSTQGREEAAGAESFSASDTSACVGWQGSPAALAALEATMLLEDEQPFKYRFSGQAPKTGKLGGSGGGGKKSPELVTTYFSVTNYYPKQFHALRAYYCAGDFDFIESMSRSEIWRATGGKSGSTFSQTKDHRFILKYVSRAELNMFLEYAQSYFAYMAKACFHGLPSVLIKLLGLYHVAYKRDGRRDKMNKFILVMPNLFYNREVTNIFDLKGSARNRYIKLKGKEKVVNEQEQNETSGNEITIPLPAKHRRVLLDQNFMEYTEGAPLPLDEKSKGVLSMAVYNDSLFLSGVDVVDYSMLVGFNTKTRRLYVGIIDYIQHYTWDKRLESVGKSVGMIAGKSRPTVISPNSYKARFRMAMDRYFMQVPSQSSRPTFKAKATFKASAKRSPPASRPKRSNSSSTTIPPPSSSSPKSVEQKAPAAVAASSPGPTPQLQSSPAPKSLRPSMARSSSLATDSAQGSPASPSFTTITQQASGSVSALVNAISSIKNSPSVPIQIASSSNRNKNRSPIDGYALSLPSSDLTEDGQLRTMEHTPRRSLFLRLLKQAPNSPDVSSSSNDDEHEAMLAEGDRGSNRYYRFAGIGANSPSESRRGRY